MAICIGTITVIGTERHSQNGDGKTLDQSISRHSDILPSGVHNYMRIETIKSRLVGFTHCVVVRTTIPC